MFIVLTRHDGVPMRVNVKDISMYSPRELSVGVHVKCDLRMTDGWSVIVNHTAEEIDQMLIHGYAVIDGRQPSPGGVPSSPG